MFSVIIPTMWKSPRITQLLTDLCECEFVGEIIIIDNNPSESQPLPNDAKIALHLMAENIYVNPAWNYGVERAKHDNILICNDDINFNPEFLSIFDDSLQHVGIIGMAFENYQLKADANIHLKAMKQRPYGWGCLMLMNKSKYVAIPEDLLIANGDDWLAQNATPYELHGLSIQSEISTTSRMDEFGMIQHNDNETYKTKYAHQEQADCNVGKWDNWYKELGKTPSAYKYSETETYKIAADFLKGLNAVEDWGVGAGGFLNHLPTAIGVDGSDTPFAQKKFIDLCNYTTLANGIHLRHVLEHNYNWQKILTNALYSAIDKVVITFFIPLSDKETKELAHNFKHGVDVPDLSISKNEFNSILKSFKLKLVEVETLKTQTGYGVEVIYKITKQ